MLLFNICSYEQMVGEQMKVFRMVDEQMKVFRSLNNTSYLVTGLFD